MPHENTKYLCLAVGLCLFASIGFCGQDDPLGPPGSDAARMKNLNQIEPRTIISSLPYVITNRGSYYLTGSLTATVGTNGIVIAANDVTIDLNGFMLIGVTNMGACGITEDWSTNLLYESDDPQRCCERVGRLPAFRCRTA